MEGGTDTSAGSGASVPAVTVAIVVPSFNTGAYIGATIESVLAQSFPDWSLVVVDDGSTDDTRTIVEGFTHQDHRISLVSHAHNRGISAARNTGAAASASELLYFLDADDILEPEMLRTMVDYLHHHGQVTAVYARQSYIDGSGTWLGDEPGVWPWARCVATRFWVTMLPDSEADCPFESIYVVAAIICSLAVVRRDAFERIDGWDEDFGPFCEDTDFFLRLRLDGAIHFLPRTLVRYRQHPTQATVKKADTFAEQYAKVHQKIATVAGPTTSLVADAEWFRRHRFVPYRQLTAAGDALRHGDLRGAARKVKGFVTSYSPRHPPGSLFRT